MLVMFLKTIPKTLKSVFFFSNLDTNYVNNFPNAADTLKTIIKKNQKLQAFLDKTKKEKKLGDLNFYLIMPVQSKPFLNN
jgi:RecG-like helicase